FGGRADQINSYLAHRGVSSFAAANILTPINLYGSVGALGANYRFRPFGRPAGVRMVQLDGIEPGAEISVGGKSWKVFPEFARDIRTSIPRGGAGGYYYAYESSWLFGLAYAMD